MIPKKKQKVKFLFILLIFHVVKVSIAQWQPDARLTNDGALSFTSVNNSRCIAASGNFVHVVWYDTRDGNAEIYYNRSTDGGISWGQDTRLTNNNAFSEYPFVAVSGSVVHVLWHDSRDGNWEIYYKRSTDGGISWEEDSRLTSNSVDSRNPSLSISGKVVHVVWHDNRDGNYEIYYKRSTNSGISWGPDVRLTNNPSESAFPSVSVSGSVVHVVWYDQRGGNSEIYYKRSSDGGISWHDDTTLTNNSAPSYYPSGAASGSAMYVTWYDERNGNLEIFFKRSTTGGLSWEPDIRLTNNSASSEIPSISVSNSVVHIAWQDNRDGNAEIYYKRSTDGGMNWEADKRLTNNLAVSYSPFVSVSDSIVHIVWYDGRDGNPEIYYKRNPSGNPESITNITMIMEGFYNISTNDLNKKDTLKTYLRSTISPFTIVDSTKSVIDSLTFNGNFFFNNASSGLYYIVLKHRNSIETWSKSGGESLVKGTASLSNFVNSITHAFGNNMKQVNTSPVLFAIYSGDVNQDGFVDGSDKSLIENDANNFLFGYVSTDITGDDVVDATDAAIADNNAFNFVSKITP